MRTCLGAEEMNSNRNRRLSHQVGRPVNHRRELRPDKGKVLPSSRRSMPPWEGWRAMCQATPRVPWLSDPAPHCWGHGGSLPPFLRSCAPQSGGFRRTAGQGLGFCSVTKPRVWWCNWQTESLGCQICPRSLPSPWFPSLGTYISLFLFSLVTHFEILALALLL